MSDITGTSGRDRLHGTPGQDTLAAGDGNDALWGGAGDDRLDGGSGLDTAEYDGPFASYKLSALYEGPNTSFSGTRVEASFSGEGNDVVDRSVEYLRFADGIARLDGGSVYFFATPADGLAPLVSGFSAAASAGIVAESAPLVLRFNEAVQRGTGLITLTERVSGRVVEHFDAAVSTRLAIDGDSVTLTPTEPLMPATAYRLSVSAGSLRDLSGNGLASGSTWDFSTRAQRFQIEIKGSAAADSLAGTAASEVLRGEAGDDTLTPGAGDDKVFGGEGRDVAVLAGTYAAASITPLYGGKDNSLQSYTVLTGAGGEDLIDKDVEVLRFDDGEVRLGGAELAFTPREPIAPVLVAAEPEGGATDVPVGTTFTLRFGEPIRLGVGLIQLLDADGAVVESFDAARSTRLAVDDQRLAVDPSADLARGARYTLVVNAGAVEDLAGNPTAATTRIEFDSEYESAIGSDGADVLIGGGAAELLSGGAGNDVLIGRGGDDVIRGGLGTDVAQYDGPFSVYQITPRLEGGVPRGWRVSSSVMNEGVDEVAADVEFLRFSDGFYALNPGAEAFTATGAAALTVVAMSPAANAASVPVDANLVFTFSEPIVRGVGTIRLNTATGGFVESFFVTTSTRLDYSGATLTIDPITTLQPGTEYALELALASVKNDRGTFFAGLPSFRFTTAVPDTTAPLAVSFVPARGAGAAAVTADLRIGFDEPVQRGTGELLLKDASGTVVERFAVATSTAIVVTGATLAVDPAADLLSGGSYTLEVPAGAVKDLAGNAFAGLADYGFRTAPNAVTGSPRADRIGGSAGVDILDGQSGDDRLFGGPGNDELKGGDGVDTAVYAAALAASTIRKTPSTLAVGSAADGNDTLESIERLQFADASIAFDLAGRAGVAAQVIGAVFGREWIAAMPNSRLALGTAIAHLDAGLSERALFELAIAERLGPGATHAQIVDLVYRNVVGTAPGAAEAQVYVNLLAGGRYSVGELGMIAARSTENLANIGFAGLGETGLVYQEVTLG